MRQLTSAQSNELAAYISKLPMRQLTIYEIQINNGLHF